MKYKKALKSKELDSIRDKKIGSTIFTKKSFKAHFKKLEYLKETNKEKFNSELAILREEINKEIKEQEKISVTIEGNIDIFKENLKIEEENLEVSKKNREYLLDFYNRLNEL